MFAPPGMVTQRDEVSTTRNKVFCLPALLYQNEKNLFATKTRNTKKLGGRSCANTRTSFLPFAFHYVQSKVKEKGKISLYLPVLPEIVTQRDEISTTRNKVFCVCSFTRKRKEPTRRENEKHKKAERKKLY